MRHSCSIIDNCHHPLRHTRIAPPVFLSASTVLSSPALQAYSSLTGCFGSSLEPLGLPLLLLLVLLREPAAWPLGSLAPNADDVDSEGEDEEEPSSPAEAEGARPDLGTAVVVKEGVASFDERGTILSLATGQ